MNKKNEKWHPKHGTTGQNWVGKNTNSDNQPNADASVVRKVGVLRGCWKINKINFDFKNNVLLPLIPRISNETMKVLSIMVVVELRGGKDRRIRVWGRRRVWEGRMRMGWRGLKKREKRREHGIMKGFSGSSFPASFWALSHVLEMRESRQNGESPPSRKEKREEGVRRNEEKKERQSIRGETLGGNGIWKWRFIFEK